MGPEDVSISFGDESIPVTMTCEVEHMTLDQAIASGLFDVPDEPGMVHIPVTLDVCIPNHVLWPARPAADRAGNQDRSGVPPWDPSRPPRKRLGNYPKAIAAENIARSFRTTQGSVDAAEAKAFGDMLRATRLGSGGSAPAGEGGAVEAVWPGSPVSVAAIAAHPLPLALRRAQAAAPVLIAEVEEGPGEEEGCSLLDGPAEDLAEAARVSNLREAAEELRGLEPDNPELTSLRPPDWVPDDAAVARMEGALAAARARSDPSHDKRPIEEQLGLSSPARQSGAAGDAGGGFGDAGSPRTPSFRAGESDDGKGLWDANGRQFPKGNPKAAAYQQFATGAPAGMEYKLKDVPKNLMPSGVKYFDSYDPETNSLIDAKAYNDWPTERFERSMDIVTKQLENDAKIAQHFGKKLELRVATEEKADVLRVIVKREGIENIVIKYWPYN